MDKFQYYNKKNEFEFKEGIQIKWPSYVLKAQKNYRVDVEKGILYKKCCNCNEWFKVAIIKGNEFVLDYDENEMHYHGGTFSSRCSNCALKLKQKQEEEQRQKYYDEFIAEGYILPSQIETYEDLSVYLSGKNKMYLKHLAIITDADEKEILNNIITGLRKQNPIEYTENVERFW